MINSCRLIPSTIILALFLSAVEQSTNAQQPAPTGPNQVAPARQPLGPAPPPASANPPTRRPQPTQIHAPFRLTPQEEAYLDRVLAAWQTETDKIKTFTCKFSRWNYNPAFEHPQYKDMPIVVNDGELKYATPDKGTFHVLRVRHLNAKTGKYEDAKDEHGEHWVCDGKSIWEHDHKEKCVIERPIPEELQGQAIRNTPLPFLFGSRAEDLKRRYFLRIVTPKEFAEKEIWVDAFPRSQQDAANFQRAIMRLDRSTFHPVAMRIYDPGDTYSSYEFSKIQVNHPWEKIRQFFAAPRAPLGWRRVLELPPDAASATAAGRTPAQR